MNTSHLRQFFTAALLASVALVASAAAPPNILFVFTDDQAPWAIGASDNPIAHTPNMDKLFAQGAYLKNSFTVTPVCSPSRASLLTSRYGTEVGITEWLHPRNETDLGLDPNLPTWPKLLQQAGYRTALIGKWHLGLPDAHHPTNFGYDYFMGFRGGGLPPVDPTLEKDGVDTKFKGLIVDILTDHAIAFLKDNAARPFMLAVHYRAPHARWLPVADEDWAPYADLDPPLPDPDYPNLDIERVKKMTREYLASVSGVDRNLGRLLGTLDQLNLADNTVVIYSSDHGYNMGHAGIWHKGNGHYVLTENPPATENVPAGQRPNMFDRSVRVPTAVRWPGVIAPNTVVEHTITNLDWFPTILSIAGVTPPKRLKLQGRDATPILTGQTVEKWNDTYYAQYSTRHQSHTHMRMIRTPQWKLVRDFLNPSRDELYNLVKDPHERDNLIHATGKIPTEHKTSLHNRLLKHLKRIDDPVLSIILQK